MKTTGNLSGPSKLPLKETSAIHEYIYASTSARRGNASTSAQFESIFLQCADPSITMLQRSILTANLLEDMTSDECSWSPEVQLSALKSLKELSRLPGSAETMAKSENIHILVDLTKHQAALVSTVQAEASRITDITSTPKQALDLLLRILNNILLQHSESRQTFASSPIQGAKLALHLVKTSASTTIVFLAARLIFFSTLYEAVVTKEAVESWNLVEIFSQRTEELVSGGSTSPGDLALAELQKAFFNVGIYYPRLAQNNREGKAIVGENFDEVLLPFLLPTIHLVVAQSSRSPISLTPPLTNAIAVLLNFPVAPYQSIWSTTFNEEFGSVSRSGSVTRAKRMATSIFGRSSSPSSNVKESSRNNTFLAILIDLLNEFLLRYFTTLDSDDEESKHLAQADGVELEDYAEPALLLCRRLVDEVFEFRRIVKRRILPTDIDRSQGLDKRKDLTGVMVRLMSSSIYPRLARASGEVLLALCDGQATKMTAEIGYGPCAGFLSQIGQLNSLPLAPVSDSLGQNIDPITGIVLSSTEEMTKDDETAGVTMTEEEKEAEAERLFDLFDRLDRNGVIKVQNPFKQAIDTGKISEIEERQEEEEKNRIQDEEDEVETTVEREMKAFRLQQKRLIE